MDSVVPTREPRSDSADGPCSAVADGERDPLLKGLRFGYADRPGPRRAHHWGSASQSATAPNAEFPSACHVDSHAPLLGHAERVEVEIETLRVHLDYLRAKAALWDARGGECRRPSIRSRPQGNLVGVT